MAQRSAWRRRTAVMVLLASVAALLATTPAIIESRLTAAHSGSVELTADTPRASGRVLLTLAQPTLPQADPGTLRDLTGTVRFAPGGDEQVVLTVEPVGVTAAPYEEYGETVWPIEQLCRVAEPCEREFEVTLEWLAPEEGATRLGSFSAALEIIYHEVETNPPGAEATWSDVERLVATPAGPGVTASTDAEQIVLDTEHPAAIRHVTLTASEAVRSGRVVGLVDIRVTQADATAVKVALVPDEMDVGGQPITERRFDPFTDCPPADPCERGATILIQLAGGEKARPAVVSWSLAAHATFPNEVGVPHGSELAVAVDERIDLGPETPRQREELSGRLDSTVGAGQARISIKTTAASLGAPDAPRVPPIAIGMLMLESTAEVAVTVHRIGADGGQSVKLSPAADRVALVVTPLADCPIGVSCDVELILTASTATPAMTSSPEPVIVDWSLSLEVLHPGPSEVPSQARVELDVLAR